MCGRHRESSGQVTSEKTGRSEVERANRRSPGSFVGLLGIEILDIRDGSIDGSLEIRPELLAPNGYLHAGTVVTLADTMAGYGCWSHLPEGSSGFTTAEIKTNFLGTARSGVLSCTATLRHAGRSTQVWDAEVLNDQGKAIALFRCTQMILYPRA